MSLTVEEHGYAYPAPVAIQSLPFSHRVLTRLERRGVSNVSDLASVEALELMALGGFGIKSLVEVEQVLRSRGLSLRGYADTCADHERDAAERQFAQRRGVAFFTGPGQTGEPPLSRSQKRALGLPLRRDARS